LNIKDRAATGKLRQQQRTQKGSSEHAWMPLMMIKFK
jgi:hypothetical protein